MGSLRPSLCYMSCLTVSFGKMLKIFEDTNFTDVTLVCGEGRKFKAHKVILSSCSSMFSNILINNPHPNPLVYFYDIKEEQMEILVKFIYTGETSVAQDDLDALLDVA